MVCWTGPKGTRKSRVRNWYRVRTRASSRALSIVRAVLEREGVEVDQVRPCSRASSCRQAATGESMPPESSARTRPEVPTGKPPGPGSRSAEIEDPVLQDLDEERERRARRGPRGTPVASWIAAPTSRSRWPESMGKAFTTGAS